VARSAAKKYFETGATACIEQSLPLLPKCHASACFLLALHPTACHPAQFVEHAADAQ
jgi:hypothetical protein